MAGTKKGLRGGSLNQRRARKRPPRGKPESTAGSKKGLRGGSLNRPGPGLERIPDRKADTNGRLPRRRYFFAARFFGATPRIVALGTEACFIKALGEIPTICLNCFEKW